MAVKAAQLKIGTNVLSVTWLDGTVTDLPHLWLRDNCGCNDCRFVQTSEKRFLITSVPADLVPADAKLIGDMLEIRWPDGHRTAYDGAAIRRNAHPATPGRQDWGARFRPRRIPFAKFLGDDKTAAVAIEDFAATGVMVLVDAPTQRGTLEALAPRFGPLREVLFARIHDVKVDAAGYNVAHTPLALSPHNDFASYTWPPSVQALHMLVNDTPGGESIIVDGWAVLDRLRSEHPGLFDALCAMPVPFREFDDDNETYTVQPIVRCDVDGEICHLRYSNQLMLPLNPTRPGVQRFYQAYRELSGRLTDPANWTTFRLEAGQILVVASHRVLHARKAFEPVGKRHLQDAYFELDNVINHRVVLARRIRRLRDD